MSADNFIGIYKVNNRKFIGRDCLSDCERGDCKNCWSRIVFTAKSLPEAVKLAQEALNNPDEIYEYGYRFFNLGEVK